MNNLELIIVLAAWLAVPVSIWGIIYFSARIITSYRVRRDLGDMPSVEEISAHYQEINSQYNHSPAGDKSAIVKKSTL